jgi:hypothetical protein
MIAERGPNADFHTAHGRRSAAVAPFFPALPGALPMKRMLAAALLLLTAACATAPRGPAPLNPVGTFEFLTTVGGNPVSGGMDVTGQPGAYAGTIRTSVTTDIPITSVAVTGQQMVVTGDTPDGPVTITVTFTGDTFTGRWALNGDGGDLSGRRTP